MQMKDYGSDSPATSNGSTSNGPTSSSDRQRRGKGTTSPVNRKNRGTSSRPVPHQGMQRRGPADRGISGVSAYQHEHTTSRWNGPVVRRPLRTVPLVPLEGASDTPRRKESAQAVWSYVGDTGDIAPVTPTAPSFSSGPDEAINADGLIPAPLDHNTTGVHRYNTPAPAFSDTDEAHLEALATTGVYHYDYDDEYDAEYDDEASALPDSGATWSTDAEDDLPPSPNRYRRAYGSVSARPRRNPNTDETMRRHGMGGSPANPATPIPPVRTDALAGRNPRTDALVNGGRNVRTEALVGGGYAAAQAAQAHYQPTTAALGDPYDHPHTAVALRSRRDTAFLMLLTLLVLSIIGIMSCNYLLSMYHL